MTINVAEFLRYRSLPDSNAGLDFIWKRAEIVPTFFVFALCGVFASIMLLSMKVEAAVTHNNNVSSKPNIVVIIADDLGWRDVGYHGSEIQTPNIDRIAQEGIELDRFYVQPTCSPTRSALMTGKSPLRLGILRPIGKNETDGIGLEETLLPEQLGRIGYQSMMVGKWHLGHHTPDLFPQARGFEYFYGHITGGIGYWDHNHGGGHDWQRNGQTLREDGYSTNLIAQDAIRVLENRDVSRPLFLYLSFNAPHLPNEAPPEAINRYRHIEDHNRRVHAAMVDELDRAIGRILLKLEIEGMMDNTIVVFSSDNGGASPFDSLPRSIAKKVSSLVGRPLPVEGLEFLASNVLDGASDNMPLAKGKGSVSEGGVRVPASIWWPGHLAGKVHSGFMSASDLLPTLLEAVGEKQAIPSDLDGASQWGVLVGNNTSQTPDYMISGRDGEAIYRSPWKLIIDDKPRLYNIYNDPYEINDLSSLHPMLVEELLSVAEAWPRTERVSTSILEYLLDPPFFGGKEDREPWADVANNRVTQGSADVATDRSH